MKKVHDFCINNAFPIALFTFAFVVCSYAINFYAQNFSKDSADWGTFGDFVGGTLNPLLSFLALMILLRTFSMQRDGLAIQREELELQKNELRANREQFQKSAEAQENNVKLSALMAIWEEDKNKIIRNDESISSFKKADDLGVCFDEEDYKLHNVCTQQNKILKSRREIIFTEIEKILRESGVAIPEMPMG